MRRIEDGTIDLFANSEMPSISPYDRNLVLPNQAIRCWQKFQKQTQMVMEHTRARLKAPDKQIKTSIVCFQSATLKPKLVKKYCYYNCVHSCFEKQTQGA